MFETNRREGNPTPRTRWLPALGIPALAVLLSLPAQVRAQSSLQEGGTEIHGPTTVGSSPTATSASSRGAPEPASPSDAELGLVPGRPRVRPTRVDVPPQIDGLLDDEAWERAAVLTDFVQQAPLDGAPATEETEVFVAYDDDHLYLAIHAHYEQPGIMRANRVDRDRAMADDLFTVYLDPFLDQQRAYDFDVNAYGVQGDGVLNAGGGGGAIPRADRSWDALFETGGRIVPDGFTAEMAIPFKSLRYPSRSEEEVHRWGFQVVREVKSKDQENIVWAPMSRGESSFFAQMGVMEGMTGLSTSRNLEIMPTVTAVQYGSIDPARPGGPGFVNQSADPDAGVNLKYGITSNLTADFTLNPDFSQIESDRPQIEVNQRFPLFYQELRPFFVEGAEIFEVSAPVTVVHTRTIVDPDYGAKLSGKVGRLSLGVLAANDAAPGNVGDPTDPLSGQKAQTYIGRAKLNLYSESHVGAVLTDREFMDGHSRLAGFDGNFRLGSTRTLNFNLMGTRLRDLDGAESDGYLTDIRLQQSGRNLDWTVLFYQVSPEFETDVGFVRRTDQRYAQANVGYTFWPESWIIDWGPDVTFSRNYDFDGTLQDEQLRFGGNVSFARNIGIGGSVIRSMERFGGIDFEKQGFFVRGNVNTSRTVAFGGSFAMGEQIRYSADPFLGDQLRWNVNTTLRPFSRFTSRLNLEASRLTDPSNGDQEVFDVKIARAQSTFQFTDRLLLRNITEYNTYDHTFDLNLLATYRVNAGTVFYVGYDDHYRQADLIEGDINGDGLDEQLYYESDLRRTNRALFAKFQYLFRL